MIIILTVLFRVLLFASALFMLLCCTVNVNVKANSGSSSGSDDSPAKVKGNMEDTTLKVNGEEEIKQMIKNVKAVGNEVEEFYNNFENNVFGLLKTITVLNKRISEAETNFSKEAGKIAKLSEIKQHLTDTRAKIDKLTQPTETVLKDKEKEQIKNKISDLKRLIEALEKTAAGDDSSIGGEDKIDLEKATEVTKLANEIKTLAEQILEEITKENDVVSNFLEIFTQTRGEIEKTIPLVNDEEAPKSKGAKSEGAKKSLEEFQQRLITFIETATNIQTTFKTINDKKTKLQSLCEELATKAKGDDKLNGEIINGQKSNEDNVGAASRLLETGKDTNEKEKENTEKTKNGTVSSSNSSGVVVTHFIVFFVFTVLCAGYL